MERRIILLILLVLSHIALSAQDREGTKGGDFIITIDGDIVKTIYRPEIVILERGAGVKSLSVSYHPGDLSLAKIDQNYLLALGDSVKLLLKFEHYEYTIRENQRVLNYEIEIGKEWLEQE